MKRSDVLQQFDKRVLAGLQANILKARLQLKQFRSACKTCRAVTDTYVNKFNGPHGAYSLGFRNEAGSVWCPKCNRCVWAKD